MDNMETRITFSTEFCFKFQGTIKFEENYNKDTTSSTYLK